MTGDVQSDPSARLIARDWRRLTGGRNTRDPARRTLVACSAGADSSALAISLAVAGGHIVLAHIVHDLRPRPDALADRDAAASLAASLGCGFAEATVAVRRQPGNAEGVARRERYAALAALAASHGCAYVAVAHHADDVLETMLMRLMRGSGPRGLAVLRPRRTLTGTGAVLIRPMLGVSGADARRICRLAGWTWREDATNADTSRLRAAIRAHVTPELRRLAPAVALHARATAELLADAADLVDARVSGVMAHATSESGSIMLPRRVAAAESDLVVGEVIRSVVRSLGGGAGMDRVPWRVVRGVVGAVKDGLTDPRQFDVHRCAVTVSAHDVVFRVREGSGVART